MNLLNFSMGIFLLSILAIIILFFVGKRKSFKWLFSLLVSLILISSIPFLFQFTFYEDYMGVNGLGDRIEFSYQLNNDRIYRSSNVEKVRSYESKETLFERISNDCEVFEINDDYIDIVYSNEIFSIRSTQKGFFGNTFVLYNNTFYIRDDSEAIPFPINNIVPINMNDNYYEFVFKVSDSFKINCSFQDLKNFYEYYDNVHIENNVISYKKYNLTVNDDVVIITKF